MEKTENTLDTANEICDNHATWLGVVESLYEWVNSKPFKPRSLFEYDNHGIERIPYTNKLWINATGTETDPKVGLVWLKQGRQYRARDGLIHTMLIKYYKGFEWRMVTSMVNNTLLCKKLSNIDIRPDAVDTTLYYYLQDYTNCPKSLLKDVSGALAFIAKMLIDLYSEYSADELKVVDDKYIRNRGATDYTCREDLWNMLKSHGIERFKTRKQQEDLVDKILGMPKFSHLKKSTRKCILERLRENGGLRPTHQQKDSRVSEIKQKQASRIPLTHAERLFKSKNKELFK